MDVGVIGSSRDALLAVRLASNSSSYLLERVDQRVLFSFYRPIILSFTSSSEIKFEH